MAILLKDAHKAASSDDGARVLVDRQMPPDADTQFLELKAWLPMLGPSGRLRLWLVERPSQWAVYRRRYLAELRDQEATDGLGALHTIAAREQRVTLLTAAKDPEHSHAAILRDLLEGAKKPPATTGPARTTGDGRVRARRNR